MTGRFICGVAIAACTAATALIAAERATFTLVNGERKSGTVVFHGGDRENLIDGHLNLGLDNKTEITIPTDQVALIQFVGGRPSMTELQSLPADNSQVLVRRNGDLQRGRFVNIIGGDTVKWQDQNGNQQMIPTSDVQRIYLKPDSVRQTFNVSERKPDNIAVATAGTVLEAGATRVEANQWTSTGLTVRAADLVSFRATGLINFGQGVTQTANPDGNASLTNPAYPVPAVPVGALIAKVGNSAPFPIGSNTQPIRMPTNGTLMLGVNDNEMTDNSGFFSVVVTRR